jgi:hypothetical protein
MRGKSVETDGSNLRLSALKLLGIGRSYDNDDDDVDDNDDDDDSNNNNNDMNSKSRPPLWSSGQSSWLQNGDVLFPVRYKLNLYTLCRRM